MTDNIIICPVAMKEIEEAWQWYENRRDGLGDDSVLCVEKGGMNMPSTENTKWKAICD